MPSTRLKEPFQYERIPFETLQKHQKKRAEDTWGTVKRLLTYLIQYKWMLLIIISMVMLSSSMALLGPYLIGMAIDDFIVLKEAEGLLQLVGWLIVIYILHSVSIFLQNFWMIGVAQKTVFTLRKELFEQFHQLPISFFDSRQQGELMSRVTNDIDNINNTLNDSVIQIFTSIVTLIGTVSVMLYLSPLLTLITMTIVPLLFIGMRWITKRTGPLYKLQQDDLGELNGYVEEIVSGQLLVKTYSQEEKVKRQFKEKNDQLQLSFFWAQNIAGFIPKVMNSLNFLSFMLIALFGGLLVINGFITVGVIVIFTEYARQFTRPLNELSNQFNILLSAVAGAERVFNILDEEPEELDETNAKVLTQTKGQLRFEHVSFSYGDKQVLFDLSFQADPGEMVAFVGHTGAGKTTIVNLISRFYEYNQGHILLDGQELNQITRSSLRSHIAFVLQDTFLFKGTVRENIRYGKLTASDEEVIQASQRANAHEFIERLPHGYDTQLDQDGSSISQGQKQLLTIARAMISDPSILILDEATSNIDTITEYHIQEGLQRLMEDRTSFVIAHRLNTIQRADKIIMLQDGRILEKGNHAALMRKQGAYYELYRGLEND
ncbi:MAG TPA: ABC transporter ATP-binding protein [Pseudogracilibacillus sp.]|nr:ABC transporter ATP-binding protein [Pseudogracilibacillus sp.]